MISSSMKLIFFLRPNHISLFSHKTILFPLSFKTPSKPFSTTLTQYPLQYDLILSRPPKQNPRPKSLPEPQPDFDNWVENKLTNEAADSEIFDKEKRKYYNKRRKRMYGSDSEDENREKNGDGFVELTPEVVEFRTLQKREEELYFYDAFAYPWEKEKHYKMVYQLEKKYFPDQGFDKAFLVPGKTGKMKEKGDEKGLIFFEGKEESEREKGLRMELKNEVKKDVKIDLSEKKVAEFFRGLKKVPSEKGGVDIAEPFVSTRSSGLPPKWDGPNGTMVLVNKPKGLKDKDLIFFEIFFVLIDNVIVLM